MNKTHFLKFIKDNVNWGRLLGRDSNPNVTSIRNYLKSVTNFLPEDARITQRAWHVINEIYEIPVCIVCKKEKVKYDLNDHTYRKYCSIKCSGLCPVYRRNFEESNIKKYGVPYSAMHKDVHAKVVQTNLARYGVEYTAQSKLVIDKQRETNLARYGVTSTSQIPSIKARQLASNIAKYGYEYANSTVLSEDIRSKLSDKDWLTERHYTDKLSCSEIAILLGCDVSTVCKYFKKFEVEVKQFFTSSFEKDVKKFLEDNGLIIIENDRRTVPKHELDVYIPSHKIAIECNGLYWHSEHFKNASYHSKKLNDCNQCGIRLIQILENEWLEKKDIVKRKLLSILGKDESKKVYARKCTTQLISSNAKRDFFDNNHIQGNGPSSINVGLIHENEIVAVMGFIKERNYFILNRYATNCIVVGGFTKLLNFFEKEHTPCTIITYADLRWSEGDLYKNSGFVLDKELDPDYYWCKGNRLWHKFNWRHKQMATRLKKYDTELSEVQNMYKNNFFRVYDCGKLRYKRKAA